MLEPSFIYKANVVRVIDGDTIVVDVDLGMRVFVRQSLRLYGINAPELRGPKAEPERATAAKVFMADLLSQMVDYTNGLHQEFMECVVKTFKNAEDKYGRWLAIVENYKGENVNDLMVQHGHAVPYLP